MSTGSGENSKPTGESSTSLKKPAPGSLIVVIPPRFLHPKKQTSTVSVQTDISVNFKADRVREQVSDILLQIPQLKDRALDLRLVTPQILSELFKDNPVWQSIVTRLVEDALSTQDEFKMAKVVNLMKKILEKNSLLRS